MFVYSLVSFSLLSVSQFCFLLLLFSPKEIASFPARTRACVYACVCVWKRITMERVTMIFLLFTVPFLVVYFRCIS